MVATIFGLLILSELHALQGRSRLRLAYKLLALGTAAYALWKTL